MTRMIDYVIDTEFVDLGDTLTGISIGVVCVQDGREFYAVNAHIPQAVVSTGWLGEHVWPYLPRWGGRLDLAHPSVLTSLAMAEKLTAFFAVSNDPGYADEPVRNRLWAWYGAFDFVVLARFVGGFLSMGRPVPQHMNCLRAYQMNLPVLERPDMPQKPRDSHHALNDAHYAVAIGKALGAFE